MEFKQAFDPIRSLKETFAEAGEKRKRNLEAESSTGQPQRRELEFDALSSELKARARERVDSAHGAPRPLAWGGSLGGHHWPE